MLSNKAMGAAKAVEPAYVEDVFSTYLYTGNGSTQTITNGIDLAGKGGLVWGKNRAAANEFNRLSDTVRGGSSLLFSNTTSAAQTQNNISAFNSNGFTFTSDSALNYNNNSYVAWTFRKQPKFFDVVTYTGTGGSQTINHDLGSTPGCIIVKRTSDTEAWYVYHRSLNDNSGDPYSLVLNTTAAQDTGGGYWGTPTSTQFTVKYPNAAGQTYVAYLFAHDAGGFGLSGTENVISCGSFTTDGSGVGSANLNFEPQWVLYKNSNNTEPWRLMDSMRGMPDLSSNLTTSNTTLFPNTSGAESGYDRFWATSTGVHIANGAANSPIIYIAIRRGPMKVPTLGTTVYNAIARTGTGGATNITGVGFSPDLVHTQSRDSYGANGMFDRLRGAPRQLRPASTVAEQTTTDIVAYLMDGVATGGSVAYINDSGIPYINHFFRRAPSFFDVVCYTGTGVARTVAHNLAAVPELIIVKNRVASNGWITYCAHMPAPLDNYLFVNSTGAASTVSGTWKTPTTTTWGFDISFSELNTNGSNYVSYLFATCPGVSKVGSYTGNGTSQVINCGFTSGARFVLIKSTTEARSWCVFDTARGIVSGNDPVLYLQDTGAETTSIDWLAPNSTGFEIVTSQGNVNGAGQTYIFLAVA